MSKQEATDFVIGELVKRRDRSSIIQELCARTGGSREQIEHFVQLVESSHSSAAAPTSPTTSAVPKARPTQPPASVQPVRLAATGGAPAQVQPSVRLVESSRPATRMPVALNPPPPPPVTATQGDALNTPENVTFVIKEIAGSRHRNDVIMTLCEKTGSSWDQARRFVQKVESENRQAIAARQSPLLILIGVGIIIVGLFLVAYYGYRTLTGTIYIFLNMPIPYLGNAVYIGTGLAMMAGGSVGLLRTARSLIK
jgi:hypothetical protein